MTIPLTDQQRDLLLRVAKYLREDGATEDLKTMLSAARLIRRIANHQCECERTTAAAVEMESQS